MLKIGDFSKLSRVSIRMLRHYDDIGLFKPAETDTFTGYRYYREDQLFTIARITALKDMGFSLADIIRILNEYDDKDKLDEYMSLKQEELSGLIKDTEYRLKLLETARKRLGSGSEMNYDISIRTIPERYAAAVRMVIAHYQDEWMAWERMKEAGHLLIPAEPALMATVFPDQEYSENGIEILSWMTVKKPFDSTEHVKFTVLPAVTAAGCIMKGGYEQMNDAVAALISWISSNGYRVCGPMFNIYHVGPAQTSDPDEYVSEICFPVEEP